MNIPGQPDAISAILPAQAGGKVLATVQSAVKTEFRTIRWLAFLLGLAHALGSGVLAQDEYPRLQLFGGGSIATRGIEWEKGGTPMLGWQASLTGNFRRRAGVTADFAGNYGDGSQLYQFLLGPAFRFAGGEFFARALAGGAHLRPEALPATTGVAMAFGFGVDYPSSGDRACLRGSIDYMADHASGQWKHSVRAGFGIAFNFHHTR